MFQRVGMRAIHSQIIGFSCLIIFLNLFLLMFRIFVLMKKALSIFLSLLILISSTGITFSTHFCMGRAVHNELSLGMDILSCGMMDEAKSCTSDSEGQNLMAPSCCDNEFLSIEIQDDYQKISNEISFEAQFLYAFTYTFLFDYQNDIELTLAHADHSPPLLEQDYQSLYQSFLL